MESRSKWRRHRCRPGQSRPRTRERSTRNWAELEDDYKAELITRAIVIVFNITETDLRGPSRRRRAVSAAKNFAAYLLCRTTNRTKDEILQLTGLKTLFVQNALHDVVHGLRYEITYRQMLFYVIALLHIRFLPAINERLMPRLPKEERIILDRLFRDTAILTTNRDEQGHDRS